MLVHRDHLNDEAATLALGNALGAALSPGLVIHLIGDLGAGKTTLTRGMLTALGHQGRVKSPTYALLEPYTFSRLDFYHFDLYRFRHEQEWHDAGFRELFNERSVSVIEWPEKAARLVPPPDLLIELSPSASDGRDVVITARTVSGERCIEQLQQDAPP
ncbi:MAG: tRNA (adenosine(37)-N6)-threonylcarbamoyltransferase complex ATPase subunit type 1 TsaE [Burkholderiales bacterium]